MNGYWTTVRTAIKDWGSTARLCAVLAVVSAPGLLSALALMLR